MIVRSTTENLMRKKQEMQPTPTLLIDDPLAWTADTFIDPKDFTISLSDDDRRELLESIDRIDAAARLSPTHRLAKTDFVFPSLGDRLADAFEEVKSGRGFVLLRGLPLDGMSFERFMAAVWGIGTYFGDPISQNAQGELIGHVIDATAEDATPRMYRSNLELRLHNDVTAMVALACWHRSQSGGVTMLASARTIRDEIERRAQHLLEPLYRGFHYHRLGEEGPDEEPVTAYRMPVFAVVNGQLSCRYQRAGLAAGHRARGVPLTDVELEALDLFDEVARSPANRLAFQLERGDMLVLNNYAVLHARTKFTEFPEPEHRRHLVRLWLDVDGFRSVPKELNLFTVNGVPKQEGR